MSLRWRNYGKTNKLSKIKQQVSVLFNRMLYHLSCFTLMYGKDNLKCHSHSMRVFSEHWSVIKEKKTLFPPCSLQTGNKGFVSYKLVDQFRQGFTHYSVFPNDSHQKTYTVCPISPDVLHLSSSDWWVSSGVMSLLQVIVINLSISLCLVVFR